MSTVTRPLAIYQLETIRNPIVEHEGVRYKTGPLHGIVRRTETSNGNVVVKNIDYTTVVAECLGSSLAELVQLPVPRWGIAEVQGAAHPWFCSEMQLRTHAIDLLSRGQVMKPELIADTIVFDVWTANDDRNMGGFVAQIPSTAAMREVSLLAIDFESCLVCRGESALSINSRSALALQPRHEVRKYVSRGVNAYQRMGERISHLTPEQIHAAFERLVIPNRGLLQPLAMPWRDTAEKLLVQRAGSIGFLLQEVLDA